MHSNQFKRILKTRVNDSLQEYFMKMEEMFGDDYWSQESTVAAALKGFGQELIERYDQPEEEQSEEGPKVEENKEEDHAPEEGRDIEDHKGDIWRMKFKIEDAEGTEGFKLIRAPSESHAKVLFNRWCRQHNIGVELIAISKEE